MRYCHVLAAIAVLTTGTVLHAEDYTHKASGLIFSLPKGWSCIEKAERITITNKDKSLTCVGDVIPKESAKAIFADIRKFLDSLEGFDDVEVTDGPKKEKVNGLEQAWYEGTMSGKNAKGKQKEIQWDMTIISGGKQILFLIGIGELDENEKAYDRFFESIKKAKDGDE
jgi:predicted Zn-dependent protease